MTDAFGGYDPGPIVENKKPIKSAGDGRSIRDRISEDVAAGFDKATTVVGSHASDIMGSTMGGLVDDIKNLTIGAFDLVAGSMKTMFGFGKNTIEDDQLDEAEEQTNLLGKILNIFKLQNLADKRATGSDKGILYDILAMAGITLALILAPFVAIAGFFEGLMSAWEMIKFPTFKRLFSPITNLFVKLKNLFTIGTEGTVIEKYMLKLKGGISKIGGFFKMIGGYFKMIFVGFKNTLPFFSKILQFSKFLGRILGNFTGILPIILGVWDGIMGAIEGFKETDGSMFEKIMGGIKGALVGIIKGMITIPLDLLKDMTSWLLSKFGFEDAAATLDSFSFSTLFTDAFEGFFNLVKKILDFDLTSLVPDWAKKLMGIKDKETTKVGSTGDTKLGELTKNVMPNKNLDNKLDKETGILSSPIARPMQSMSEVSNNPRESDRMTSTEIKNMSDRLDKTLREMKGGQEQSNQNQTQINQTLVNTNNTVMSGRNNIPEESSLISVQMFNGAGM